MSVLSEGAPSRIGMVSLGGIVGEFVNSHVTLDIFFCAAIVEVFIAHLDLFGVVEV